MDEELDLARVGTLDDQQLDSGKHGAATEHDGGDEEVSADEAVVAPLDFFEELDGIDEVDGVDEVAGQEVEEDGLRGGQGEVDES